jgi:hypothetical protein
VNAELIINSVAVLLSLLVLSRIAGDNPLFRVAQYLFVGCSLGYAFVVVYHEVLVPALVGLSASSGDPTLLSLRLVPFVLGLLLLPRLTNRQNFSWMANLPLGLLFGVGAALALGGALVGTLFPQLLDSARPLGADTAQLIGAIFLALGVVFVLTSFYFTVPQEGLGRVVAGSGLIGRWLIMFAFGFFFAGALLTYLTALDERLRFIVNWVLGLIQA